MSVRLTEEIDERLTKTSEQVNLSRHALAEMAIRSAVEAIERQGGRLVLPLEFTTTHEAVAKPAAPTVKTGQQSSAAGVVYPFPDDQGLKVAGTSKKKGTSGA